MITTYQIRNVLRVYGNQLKKKNALIKDAMEPNPRYADVVDISIEARRKQTLNRMSEKLISNVNPHSNTEYIDKGQAPPRGMDGEDIQGETREPFKGEDIS